MILYDFNIGETIATGGGKTLIRFDLTLLSSKVKLLSR